MNTILTSIALTTLVAAPIAFAGPNCSSNKTAHSETSYTLSAVNSYKADIIDTALAAGSFKTLAAALTEADLISTLKGKGPFTVFAPTDEAFAKLPKGTVESLLKPENREQLINILTFHVVPGNLDSGEVLGSTGLDMFNGQRADIDAKNGTIDSAKIVKTDIECSNGVIHVIDTVILPKTDTLLETAASAGSFNTLAAAIEAAGLTDALNGDGPFTVFAPTDEAFAKLPAGTVENLLKPENLDTLKSILLYHVVEGRVYSDDALNAKSAKTLQGSKLSITKSESGVQINDAKVLATDIDASNGVIHVLDSVIIPTDG
ncbi:MAG: fasciclin domain-containing protein [Phycisphaerales bacterium]